MRDRERRQTSGPPMLTDRKAASREHSYFVRRRRARDLGLRPRPERRAFRYALGQILRVWEAVPKNTRIFEKVWRDPDDDVFPCNRGGNGQAFEALRGAAPFH